MQLILIFLIASAWVSVAKAWFFPLALPPISIPLKPAPVVSTCSAAISYKPLGSFLFGSLFPNPWAGLGGSVNIPNCNAAPGPSAPTCPSGQSCFPTANPCTVSGQSCMDPPPPHRFPAQQTSANAICSGASPGLVACLNPAGTAVACCAP